MSLVNDFIYHFLNDFRIEWCITRIIALGITGIALIVMVKIMDMII